MRARGALFAGAVVLLAMAATAQRNSNQEKVPAGVTYTRPPLSIDPMSSSLAASDYVSQTLENDLLHSSVPNIQPSPSPLPRRSTSESEITSVKPKETSEPVPEINVTKTSSSYTKQEVQASADDLNQSSSFVIGTTSHDLVSKTRIHLSTEQGIGPIIMTPEPSMLSEMIVEPSMSVDEGMIQPDVTELLLPTMEASVPYSTIFPLLPYTNELFPSQTLAGHDTQTPSLSTPSNTLLISPSPVVRISSSEQLPDLLFPTGISVYEDNYVTLTALLHGNSLISTPVPQPQSSPVATDYLLPQEMSVSELFEITTSFHHMSSILDSTLPISTYAPDQQQQSLGFSPTELMKPLQTLAATSQSLFTSDAVMLDYSSLELRPFYTPEPTPTLTTPEPSVIIEAHTPSSSMLLEPYSSTLDQFLTPVVSFKTSDIYSSFFPLLPSEPLYLQTITTTELVVLSSHELRGLPVTSIRFEPILTATLQEQISLMETPVQQLTAELSPTPGNISLSPPTDADMLQSTSSSIEMLASFTYPIVQPTTTQDILGLTVSGTLLISPSPVIRSTTVSSPNRLSDLIFQTASIPLYTEDAPTLTEIPLANSLIFPSMSQLQSSQITTPPEISYVPELSESVGQDFPIITPNFTYHQMTLSLTTDQHSLGIGVSTRSPLTVGSLTQSPFSFANTHIISTGLQSSSSVPPASSTVLPQVRESIPVETSVTTGILETHTLAQLFTQHSNTTPTTHSSAADVPFHTAEVYRSIEEMNVPRTTTPVLIIHFSITSSHTLRVTQETSILQNAQGTVFPIQSSAQLLISPTPSEVSPSLLIDTVGGSAGDISTQRLSTPSSTETLSTGTDGSIENLLTHITSSPVGKPPSLASFFTRSIQPTTTVQSISTVIGRDVSNNPSNAEFSIHVSITSLSQEMTTSEGPTSGMMPPSVSPFPSQTTRTTFNPLPSRVLSTPSTTLVDPGAESTTVKLSPTPSDILIGNYTSIGNSTTDITTYLITSSPVEKPPSSSSSSFVVSVQPTTKDNSSMQPVSTQIAREMGNNTSTIEFTSTNAPSVISLETKMTLAPLPSPSSTSVDTSVSLVESTSVVKLIPIPSDVPPQPIGNSTTDTPTQGMLQSSASTLSLQPTLVAKSSMQGESTVVTREMSNFPTTTVYVTSSSRERMPQSVSVIQSQATRITPSPLPSIVLPQLSSALADVNVSSMANYPTMTTSASENTSILFVSPSVASTVTLRSTSIADNVSISFQSSIPSRILPSLSSAEVGLVLNTTAGEYTTTVTTSDTKQAVSSVPQQGSLSQTTTSVSSGLLSVLPSPSLTMSSMTVQQNTSLSLSPSTTLVDMHVSSMSNNPTMTTSASENTSVLFVSPSASIASLRSTSIADNVLISFQSSIPTPSRVLPSLSSAEKGLVLNTTTGEYTTTVTTSDTKQAVSSVPQQSSLSQTTTSVLPALLSVSSSPYLTMSSMTVQQNTSLSLSPSTTLVDMHVSLMSNNPTLTTTASEKTSVLFVSPSVISTVTLRSTSIADNVSISFQSSIPTPSRVLPSLSSAEGLVPNTTTEEYTTTVTTSGTAQMAAASSVPQQGSLSQTTSSVLPVLLSVSSSLSLTFNSMTVQQNTSLSLSQSSTNRNVMVQTSETVTSLRILQSGEALSSTEDTKYLSTSTTTSSPNTASLFSKVSTSSTITPTPSPCHPFHNFLRPPDSIVSVILAVPPSELSKIREVGSVERCQLLEALSSVYEKGLMIKNEFDVVRRRSVRKRVEGQGNINEESDLYKRQVLPESEYTAVIADITEENSFGENLVDVRFFILDTSDPSSPQPLNSTAVSEAYILANVDQISGFTVVRQAQPSEDILVEDSPPSDETGLSSRVAVGVIVAAAVLLTLVVIVLLLVLKVIWRKRHHRKVRLQASPERTQISLMSRTLVPTTSFEYESQQLIVHQHRPGPSSNEMVPTSSQEHLELASNSSEKSEAQGVITITHMAQTHQQINVPVSRTESSEHIVTTITHLAHSLSSGSICSGEERDSAPKDPKEKVETEMFERVTHYSSPHLPRRPHLPPLTPRFHHSPSDSQHPPPQPPPPLSPSPTSTFRRIPTPPDTTPTKTAQTECDTATPKRKKKRRRRRNQRPESRVDDETMAGLLVEEPEVKMNDEEQELWLRRRATMEYHKYISGEESTFHPSFLSYRHQPPPLSPPGLPLLVENSQTHMMGSPVGHEEQPPVVGPGSEGESLVVEEVEGSEESSTSLSESEAAHAAQHEEQAQVGTTSPVECEKEPKPRKQQSQHWPKRIFRHHKVAPLTHSAPFTSSVPTGADLAWMDTVNGPQLMSVMPVQFSQPHLQRHTPQPPQYVLPSPPVATSPVHYIPTQSQSHHRTSHTHLMTGQQYTFTGAGKQQMQGSSDCVRETEMDFVDGLDNEGEKNQSRAESFMEQDGPVATTGIKDQSVIYKMIEEAFRTPDSSKTTADAQDKSMDFDNERSRAFAQASPYKHRHQVVTTVPVPVQPLHRPTLPGPVQLVWPFPAYQVLQTPVRPSHQNNYSYHPIYNHHQTHSQNYPTLNFYGGPLPMYSTSTPHYRNHRPKEN